MRLRQSSKQILAVRPQLLASAAAGNEAALNELFRPLLVPAYRLAFMMLRDRTAAEDAVQEAALRCWRKLPRLSADRDPLPWFLGFVANECRNARRSRWRSRVMLGVDDTLVAASGDWGGDPDLLQALTRLRHRDRLVVLMFYYLDMPLEDIAAGTGSKTGAVRSRLYRAVKRLRSQLGAEDLSHE
ncbi:MAG TPA: sigma factor [Candidatus Limnocylindrales bacterium]|nr:sigma factor [Candidatus Limnocylindrales bacterium]